MQPHFDYTCAAWNPNLNKKYENKFHVLENKCIRFCLQLDIREHIGTEHFDKINWLPIDQRFNKCLSTSFFKFFSEMCPQYTNAIYKTTNQNNTVTRNSPIKFFQPLRTNSRADDDLKTLIIVQIFNKEDFFLVFLWIYSLCIIVFETSTFFHNRKWWRHSWIIDEI